jgi:hypothetical protein
MWSQILKASVKYLYKFFGRIALEEVGINSAKALLLASEMSPILATVVDDGLK